MRSKLVFLCLLSLFLLPLLTVPAAYAASPLQPSQVGARYGYSATNNEHTFDQAELFALWPLLGRTVTPGQVVDLGLEAFAGTLWSPRQRAFIGGAGPILRLFPAFVVSLEGGIRLTYVSEYHFKEYPYTDFGGPLQFTSHGGLIVHLGPHLELSARFQHMSNGELYAANSGLNMLMAGVGWRF